MKKKILLVDDEEKIAEVVKAYLENKGYTVYVLYSGKNVIEFVKSINPCLIILDLMLPDMSGEDICKKIRKFSRVPIMMLTAKVEENNIIDGFNIGADDYVTKPFSPKELVARVEALIRRLHDNNIPLSNLLSYNNGDLVIDVLKCEVKKKGNVIKLTQSEYDILSALIKYPDKVFTREELIFKALGDEFNGYDRIIDAHIKNLRHKIEESPKTPKYILTAHGRGYRFGDEEECN